MRKGDCWRCGKPKGSDGRKKCDDKRHQCQGGCGGTGIVRAYISGRGAGWIACSCIENETRRNVIPGKSFRKTRHSLATVPLG